MSCGCSNSTKAESPNVPLGRPIVTPVSDMSCASCAAKIEKLIGGAFPVAVVRADAESGAVYVWGVQDNQRIRELILAAGYTPGPSTQ